MHDPLSSDNICHPLELGAGDSVRITNALQICGMNYINNVITQKWADAEDCRELWRIWRLWNTLETSHIYARRFFS